MSFGTMLSLNKVASVTVSSSTELVVQPYSNDLIGAIENAIRTSEVKLNPIVEK